MTRYGKDRHSAPPTRSALALYGFVRGGLTIFDRIFWRLSIHGRKNVPSTGAFILAGVHRSNIDTVIVCAATRRRMRYMGKDTMWKYRWSAWFFSAMGGIPVSRGSADREALRLCIEIAATGEPIVMFPEGTRLEGPVVEADKMFDGPAYVASKAGIPILPVGLGGTADAMPVGKKSLRPVKLHMEIGKPIYPPEPGEGGRTSRRAVRELTETLRQEIQVLFDTAQERVGKPNLKP